MRRKGKPGSGVWGAEGGVGGGGGGSGGWGGGGGGGGGVEVSWRVRDGDGGQLEGRHLSLWSLGVSSGGGGGGATANIV